MSLVDSGSPMFSMARQARRLPGIIALIGAVFGLIIIAFVAPAVIAEIAFADRGGADVFLESIYFLVIPFLLLALCLWGWIAGFEKRPFWTLGFPLKNWLRKYLIGLLVGFSMLSLIVGFMYLAGAVKIDHLSTRNVGFAAIGSALLFLLAFIVQCSSEELLFRGWLLPVIGTRYRPGIGVTVSSLIFVIFHGTVRPLVIINLLLFSVFLSFYCIKEGSIWGICGWHTAWNWTQASFFGLEVSGSDWISGTIFDLKASGSTVISGGDYGPEASIICTLVLLAGIIIIARARCPVRLRWNSPHGGAY